MSIKSEPLQSSPFSIKVLQLLHFRTQLDKCSEDQKLQVMSMLKREHRLLIYREHRYVRNTFYCMENSHFLYSWRALLKPIKDNLFQPYIKLKMLFSETTPPVGNELIHQLLLTSPRSVMHNMIIAYTYFLHGMYNDNIKIHEPEHCSDEDKLRIIIKLSQTSSILTRRIFLLHQQLEEQILMHFHHMLEQIHLDIDLELERVLHETLS